MTIEDVLPSLLLLAFQKVLVNMQTDKKSKITSRVEREIHGDIMNVTMTVLQTSTVAHAVFKRKKKT